MPTKFLTTDQHQVLHNHWPDDCCLCRAEKKIFQLQEEKSELDQLKCRVIELEARLNALITKFEDDGK